MRPTLLTLLLGLAAGGCAPFATFPADDGAVGQSRHDVEPVPTVMAVAIRRTHDAYGNGSNDFAYNLPPGTDETGKAHKVRLYSIASPEAGEDGRGNVVCTPVKRVVDEYWPPDNGAARRRGLFMGVCSNYLCDLEVGEEVRITGPVGKRFLLPTLERLLGAPPEAGVGQVYVVNQGEPLASPQLQALRDAEPLRLRVAMCTRSGSAPKASK